MAIKHEDNDVPYRSPIDMGQNDTDVVTPDEEDYSTLANIQRDLDRELKKLSSIDVIQLKDEEKGLSVTEQIAVYQRVKEILDPIKATVDTALQTVRGKRGGK